MTTPRQMHLGAFFFGAGHHLAAWRHPDVVPSAGGTAQQTADEARKFCNSLKGQLAGYGRSTDALKILPGISPFVGRSEAEAREKFEQLQSLIDPVLGVGLLSTFLGNVDLSKYPVDGPLPQDRPVTEGWQSRLLYERVAGARGHWTVVGTAESIADQLEHWFTTGAADGFNVLAPTLPHGLKDFAQLVVPELQRRGLFRTEYTGRTLRDHLGLPRPEHPAAAQAARELATA
jgi:alkanesulfonate monooxygenase SsuD/methylene tetrahydromethanopterin reductase-like flavin-dependent oxidoreductase (luciferase family)